MQMFGLMVYYFKVSCCHSSDKQTSEKTERYSQLYSIVVLKGK